ncbi:MAG: chemotaxis protein CheB [Candidatus Omnitrophota bacterium]
MIKKTRKISFPIVGIGASAGGLEAFKELLNYLPAKTGMAFVLIQHLAPNHESMLTQLLSRSTVIPVVEAKNNMFIKPDQIYVIAPNTNIALSGRVLKISKRIILHEQYMPINYFFQSLAKGHGNNSVGIILSGSASDGVLGLEEIKAQGGVTFAQDEKTAKYDSMPHSAIMTGCVDFILAPKDIAKELSKIAAHPYINPASQKYIQEEILEDSEGLNKIFALLHKTQGIDFSGYKLATIRRRIKRRMILNQIENLNKYIHYLEINPPEIEALRKDMTITVTSFFRDPKVYKLLRSKIFPAIIKKRVQGEPFRIWVPGCSTGQEVYSIAIVLIESLGYRAKDIHIQIFASDINEEAINKARKGIYTKDMVNTVSKERLKRFFVKKNGGYQVVKAIRELCVFARQDVTIDPPFSNLDIISFRNVLIYMNPVLQKKVLSILHYALKPEGFLILGVSESIGVLAKPFKVVNRELKIYSNKYFPAAREFVFSPLRHVLKKEILDKENVMPDLGGFDIQKEADSFILSEYSPSGVVINSNMEIIQFRGRTSLYLEPVSGQASFNLLKMLKQGLASEVQEAVYKAQKSGRALKREGLQVKHNGGYLSVKVEIMPFENHKTKEKYF